MRSSRLPDAGAAGLLALLVTLPFADILFGGLNLYIRDLARMYYPERNVLASILRQGVFPDWNPLLSAGQPLAANPGYQAFYPPQLLLIAGDFRDMFHLLVVAHFPMAAVGLYLVARSIGIRPAAAFVAGLAFGLGGLMLSIGSLIPLLFAFAWLPWLALFSHRYAHTGALSNLALAGLSLGVILLAGDVSLILQAGGLVAAYSCYAIARRPVHSVRIATGAVATIGIALLIGAVQIVPALELQRESGRAVPFTLDESMRWSMHPLRLLEGFWPTLFGSGSEYALFFWGAGRILKDASLPLILNLYPGTLISLLVVAGLLCRVRGWLFALAVTIVSILMAIGPAGGLSPLLHSLGFTSFRYPEKFILSAAFVLSLFAAIAADAAARDQRVRRTAGAGGLVVATISFAIFAAAHGPGFPTFFAGFWKLSSVDEHLAARFREGMLLSGLLALVIAFLLLSSRLSPAVRAGLLVSVLFVDLGIRNPRLLPRTTADYYTPPEAAMALAAQRPAPRLYSHADWQRMNEPQPPLPTGIRHWIVRNGVLPRTHMNWGIQGVVEPDITRTSLLPTIEFTQLVESFRSSGRMDRMPHLMQMAGASHVALMQNFDPEVVFDPRRFDQVDPVRIVQTRNNGRYYFATQLLRAANVADVARILGSENPIDERVAFVAREPFAPARGTANRIEESANAIALDVEAEGRALLVLAVTPHRYWSATVDGHSTDLEPANVGFQALVLDKGRHRVVLRYRNTLARRSAWVSLVAGAIVIMVAIGSMVRRRRPVQPP